MSTRPLPYGQITTLKILRYSGGYLVTPMSTRPLPYGQMATLRILRYSGDPIISVLYHSMSDELTEEDERLSAKANVASVKTSFLKKDLERQKNLLAAKKEEAVSKNLQPSEELTTFLNDEATLGEIEKVEDKQDILARRYDCLSLHYLCLS